MLRRLFSRTPDDPRPPAIYAAIVAASRQPAFYRDLGVEDTPDGRFEMLVMHAALVMSRLSRGDEDGRALSQSVFDLMFADLDRSLRELGVGDLSVPKKIRRMAEAFYGRSKAYGVALGADAPEGALEAVIARNVFDSDGTGEEVAALARYLRAAAAAVGDADTVALETGAAIFPDVAGFADADAGAGR
jgi:cytochrome b pre-mRNA-processing protein 3